MSDGEENPGHVHPEYVPFKLCTESRAHMETKIDNMDRSIRQAVYLSATVLGIVVMLFQWYMTVMH